MIRARFLGVDRFQDEQIPELTGCARDATGLWALFTDSIPAIDARCITNEAVTYEAIGRALDETFEAAEEEDAVSFTFAGHGTHDHRLVAHDTALADLDATTVPVDDLAARFRRCRARFVLCVIDCCFSGSAPARVVMDTPTSRAILDFSAFEGTGRLLITACRPNESAYEHPLRRHGLLTVALLDALTEHDAASLDGRGCGRRPSASRCGLVGRDPKPGRHDLYRRRLHAAALGARCTLRRGLSGIRGTARRERCAHRALWHSRADRRRVGNASWGGVAIVLAILAYAGPIHEQLSQHHYLAAGMRTW